MRPTLKFNGFGRFDGLGVIGVVAVVSVLGALAGATPAAAGPLTDPAQQTHCLAVGNAFQKNYQTLQTMVDGGKGVVSPDITQSTQKIADNLKSLSDGLHAVYGDATPPSESEQTAVNGVSSAALLPDVKQCFPQN